MTPAENKQTVEAALDQLYLLPGTQNAARAALRDLVAQADRAAKLEAALRDMRALIVIDEDGAAEAIRMEDWGPVWIRGSELLAGDGGGA